MSTKRRSTKKTNPDAASILMAAYQKQYPTSFAMMTAITHPLVRQVAGRCSDHMVAMLEGIGRVAAAARAGDVRACNSAMRALDRIGSKAADAMTAELGHIGLTLEDFARALLSPSPVAPVGVATTLVAPPWPFS